MEHAIMSPKIRVSKVILRLIRQNSKTQDILPMRHLRVASPIAAFKLA
jgi:hypothetical protein